MLSFIWIVLATPQNIACSLVPWITIVTCGQAAHISLNNWQTNPVWNRKLLLIGQIKCKRHLTKCVCLWLPMLLQFIATTISSLTYTLMLLTFCIIQKGRLVAYFCCKFIKVTATCRKPLINVPYKRTFGTPDQGQTLDVWGGIQQMSTLRWRWHSYAEKSSPHPGRKSCTNQDIAGGISAMILDHTDRN